MASNAVIIAGALTRRFGEVVAVDHLDLEVQTGEIFGFLGHNGAGKTTTVRLLNGVLAPSSGTAQVLGMAPMDEGPALRKRTGVLTETPSLDERLTGRENLEIYAELYDVPPADIPTRIGDLLEIFELADRADVLLGLPRSSAQAIGECLHGDVRAHVGGHPLAGREWAATVDTLLVLVLDVVRQGLVETGRRLSAWAEDGVEVQVVGKQCHLGVCGLLAALEQCHAVGLDAAIQVLLGEGQIPRQDVGPGP